MSQSHSRSIYYSVIVGLILSISQSILALRVLHLTFHKGCHREIQWLGKTLNLDMTSLFVQELEPRWLDGETTGNEIYNITAKRAHKIWQRHADFFNSFDLIITSDTVPLSRIFLQNNWRKPLIIWVCNRFDYADGATAEGAFPDSAYYTLIQEALTQPNVRIVSYTPYERYYAKQRGIRFPKDLIKPCAYITDQSHHASAIPAHINKQATLFIPPYHNDTNLKVAEICKKMGINAYHGRYNGPQDLKDFKGIIHLPYAWSNLALFENIQYGLQYYIPSPKFFLELSNSPDYFSSGMNEKTMRYSEWYAPENRELFIYFDSWDDLQKKITACSDQDYEHKKEAIQKFAHQHRNAMLKKWLDLFHSLGVTL